MVKNELCMISTLLHFLRFVLCPRMWSILVHVPWALERMCSLCCWVASSTNVNENPLVEDTVGVSSILRTLRSAVLSVLIESCWGVQIRSWISRFLFSLLFIFPHTLQQNQGNYEDIKIKAEINERNNRTTIEKIDKTELFVQEIPTLTIDNIISRPVWLHCYMSMFMMLGLWVLLVDWLLYHNVTSFSGNFLCAHVYFTWTLSWLPLISFD